MSNLIKHAKRELKLAGLFDKDADYGGVVAEAVMELITTFSKQGHSGLSAMQTIGLFDRLSQFKNITPITDNPEEWDKADGCVTWQNKRNPSLFSEDNGKTYWDVGDPKKVIKNANPYAPQKEK